MKRGTFRRGAALFLALTLVFGCDDALEPRQDARFGVVNVFANVSAAGELTLSPSARFFEASGISLPNSRLTFERCERTPIFGGTANDLQLKPVPAGDSVGIQFGGGTRYLRPVSQRGGTFYLPTSSAPIGFTPGSNITVAVPGAPNGFPSLSVVARTAESLTLGPVDPASDPAQSLTITWNPGDTTSAILLSLKYARDAAENLNEQLECQLIDDGSITLTAGAVIGFRAAEPGKRRLDATRLRTTRVEASGVTLIVVSTYAFVRTTFP